MDSRMRDSRVCKQVRWIMWGSIGAAFTLYSIIVLVCTQVRP
ncbi:hypothetical protein EV128_125119 [Rhizobium azibense]|nr:hypothetical protein EV128_125119 [Rhizobium azibense]